MRSSIKLVAAAGAAVLGLATAEAGTVVYDNTANPQDLYSPFYQSIDGSSYAGMNGNNVTLGAGGRFVDWIEIHLFQGFYETTGTVDARVRFYLPDGPSGAPATLIWDSGVVGDTPFHGLRQVFGFEVPLVEVPDTFIWTIELSNATSSGNFNFGTLLFGPPVYGSSTDGAWLYLPCCGWGKGSGDNGARITAIDMIAVSIDVRPDAMPNNINLRSPGTVPVAVLSDHTFDAPGEIAVASLRFGRTGTEASLRRCNTVPEDVNADGLLDLICHFAIEDAGFQAGDTQGVLEGETIRGLIFKGTDSVRIVP